jgi:hypothetical protein
MPWCVQWLYIWIRRGCPVAGSHQELPRGLMHQIYVIANDSDEVATERFEVILYRVL